GPRAFRLGVGEARAIVPRRDAEAAQKAPPHPLLVAETAAPRDRGDRLAAILKSAARRLEPNRLYRPRRRLAHPRGIDAGEMPRAHGRRLGQPLDLEILLEVISDP